MYCNLVVLLQVSTELQCSNVSLWLNVNSCSLYISFLINNNNKCNGNTTIGFLQFYCAIKTDPGYLYGLTYL